MQDYIPREKDINQIIEPITVKQFDNNSRFLHVQFTDIDLAEDENAFDLENCTTALYIEPEGNTDPTKVNFVNGDIESAESGIVTFLLPGGVTQTPGDYKAEIWIYQNDETLHPIISSKPFKITVEKSIKNDSAIEATQSMSALDAKIIKVNALEKQVAELVASPAGSGGDVGTEVRDARIGYDSTEYDSLGEAVRTQAENLYNTGLTFVGKFLNYSEWNTYFSASFDALPTNTFANCNVKLSDGTIENSPPISSDATYLTGTVITLGRESKSRRANYDTQIFIPQDCEKIWARKYANNAWSEWRMIGGSYVNTFHQYRADINSDYVSYDYLISNVTDDGTFFVSQTDTSSETIVQRWNDLPTQTQNFIITNARYSLNWIVQTAIPTDTHGEVYIRRIPYAGTSGTVSEWVRIGADIKNDVDSLSIAVDSLPQYRADINNNYASYNNLISKVTDDGTFFVSSTPGDNNERRWNDLPTNDKNYIITNIGYSLNWIFQSATPTDAYGVTYKRLIPRPTISESPRDWVKVSNTDTRKVLALGDSICAGWRNGGKGFVGDLGFLDVKNKGVSGTSLSTINATSPIPAVMENFPSQNPNWKPDIIIADGGHNDYNLGAPLGDIPTEQASSVEGLNYTTAMGGLQRLFIAMNAYPNADKYFIITHRIYRNAPGDDPKNGYLPEKKNSQGYTETQLHDAIVACCRVYGITVIDVFKNSIVDSNTEKFRGDYYYGNSYSTDPNYRKDSLAPTDATNYFDKDGVHPLSRGYIEGYVPLIKEAIRIKDQG